MGSIYGFNFQGPFQYFLLPESVLFLKIVLVFPCLLSRLLSFENGDTHFVLMADSREPLKFRVFIRNTDEQDLHRRDCHRKCINLRSDAEDEIEGGILTFLEKLHFGPVDHDAN